MVSDLVSRMLFCYAVHVHIRAYVDDVLSLAWLFMHCPVRTKRSRLPKLLFFSPKTSSRTCQLCARIYTSVFLLPSQKLLLYH